MNGRWLFFLLIAITLCALALFRGVEDEGDYWGASCWDKARGSQCWEQLKKDLRGRFRSAKIFVPARIDGASEAFRSALLRTFDAAGNAPALNPEDPVDSELTGRVRGWHFFGLNYGHADLQIEHLNYSIRPGFRVAWLWRLIGAILALCLLAPWLRASVAMIGGRYIRDRQRDYCEEQQKALDELILLVAASPHSNAPHCRDFLALLRDAPTGLIATPVKNQRAHKITYQMIATWNQLIAAGSPPNDFSDLKSKLKSRNGLVDPGSWEGSS